ncbi:MAG: T9SS type A sorting domain-containing protein [bacterium]|nr:T9SS type A sorting domain-containing protein [bacterium]
MPAGYCYDVFGYGADIFAAEYMSGLRTLTYSDDAYLPNDMAKPVTKGSDAKRVSVEYVSGKIVIDYTVKNNSDISVSLYDCSGRELGVIYSGSVSGNGKVEAEAGGINKGTYFVKTKLGSDTYTEKVTLI